MQTFLLILQIVPMIIEIIRAIESIIPKAGEGPSKLETVLAIITEAVPKLESARPQVEKIIGIIVALCNRTGVFVKGATA
jgi:hypothetical protein